MEKLSVENPKLWYKHLPTALMVFQDQVNQDIGCSPFEMVYRYKPETTKSSQGLKLIKPALKPQDFPVTKEMELIQAQEGIWAQHRLKEQAQVATTFY